MRTKLKNVDGPEIHIDLNDISLIEMFGQRDSKAGWVQVKITLKSGQNVEIKMQVIDYDELLQAWNPTVNPE